MKNKSVTQAVVSEYAEILKSGTIPVEVPETYECIESGCDGIPADLPALWFRQYWDNGKIPSEKGISFLWRTKDSLNIMGVMHDSDVHSLAHGKNQKTWELGDVFEFFFQPSGGKHYFEIHLTPDLATLELSIPDSEKLIAKCYKFEDLCNYDSGMKGQSGKFEAAGLKGWWAWIKIPFSNIRVTAGAGTAGKFSICRYNYNRPSGKTPECSSTSAFKKFSFHEPGNWQKLVFVG